MVAMNLLGIAVLLLTLSGAYSEAFKPRMEKVDDEHFYNQKEVWGYAEVRKGAHSFWWLQYTTHPAGYKDRPWIIWLQGGPGLSGTALGNFLEIGPYNEKLEPRPQTWLKQASIMYIDNPVGTGFSYHENMLEINGELEHVSEDLITLLKVFTEHFPAFKTLPLYLIGQSYGGKYVSALAYYLEKARLKGDFELNLRGIGIGNGFVSPTDFITNFGPFLQQMGMIDDTTARLLANQSEEFMAVVKTGDGYQAFLAMMPVFVTSQSVPGLDPYNIMLTKVKEGPMFDKRQLKQDLKKKSFNTQGLPRFSPVYDTKMHAFMDGPVRKRLGMIPKDVLWNDQNNTVYGMSIAEFVQDASFMVEWLLNNTEVEVNVYEGQYDMMCNTAGAVAWTSRLQWPGREGWEQAEKKPMLTPDTDLVETYVKEHGNLRFFWNLKAGHTVPADVPEAAMRMLEKILANARPAGVRTRKNLVELLEELLKPANDNQ